MPLDNHAKAIASGVALLAAANAFAAMGTRFVLPALGGALVGFGIVVAGVLRSSAR